MVAVMPKVISDTLTKKKKKSAFSCQSCRHRKVKCSGEQPRCATCIARNEVCEYKLHPTLSYTSRLEARITELETALAKAGVPLPDASSNVLARNKADPTSFESLDPRLKPSVEGLTENARESLTLYRTTSFFQPASQDVNSPTEPRPSTLPTSGRRERLKQEAMNQKELEIRAATPDPFQYMLQNHWCWIQPLFNFIYRPAFTRDMQTMGPYYSHMLLNAILAHSSRWCRDEPHIRPLLEAYDDGALFSRAARMLLYEDISQGSCGIPTIQTLLILSAQECGAGNRTQAWLYSGMAFRLMKDLDISVETHKNHASRKLSDEDIEIRNRLFWSCYFWDKIISLYLGRSPSLENSPLAPPQAILDDSAEEEEWMPHGIEYLYSPDSPYPPTKAHSTSCFMQMCRLSVIFNQILLNMYNPEKGASDKELLACFYQQDEALQSFWVHLPEFLKINPTAPPPYAPPSHIVTLNCLFHTFMILLHRPILFRPLQAKTDPALQTACLKECLTSANAIVNVFSLFYQTFGDRRVILSIAYSLYTASSIFLLKIQADSQSDLDILKRMSFCLAMLDRVKKNAPIICNALDLIRRNLAKAGVDPDKLPSVIPPEKDPSMHQPNRFPRSADRRPSSSTTDNYRAFQYALPPFNDFDLSNMSMNTEVFSHLDPITAQVGVLGEGSDDRDPVHYRNASFNDASVSSGDQSQYSFFEQ